MNISLKDVTAVLLVDGWHKALNGSLSFTVHTFTGSDEQYVAGFRHGHQEDAMDFAFQEPAGRSWVIGPASSILAMRVREVSSPAVAGDAGAA